MEATTPARRRDPVRSPSPHPGDRDDCRLANKTAKRKTGGSLAKKSGGGGGGGVAVADAGVDGSAGNRASGPRA